MTDAYNCSNYVSCCIYDSMKTLNVQLMSKKYYYVISVDLLVELINQSILYKNKKGIDILGIICVIFHIVVIAWCMYDPNWRDKYDV